MLRHIFKFVCARLSRARVMQSGLWHQTQSFISIVIRLSMLQNFLLITKTSFSFVVCLFNFEASVTTWKWNLGQMHLLFHLFRLYCCAPREVWSNCSYRPAVNEPGREWEASDLQSLQKRGRTSRFVYDAMDDNFETRQSTQSETQALKLQKNLQFICTQSTSQSHISIASRISSWKSKVT